MLHELLYLRISKGCLPSRCLAQISQRFVLFTRERPEEYVCLASGDYNITKRSQFDSNAAQFLDSSRTIIVVGRGHLHIGELIVQFLHPRIAIELFGLECDHSTTTIAKLGRSYRSVSLHSLSCITSIPVSIIRRGENHLHKKNTIFLVEAAILFGVLCPPQLNSCFR